MAIFLNADSKVIVQGMTGSEGMKHTQRMLKSGTDIVGGVNPRKAGTTVDFEGGVSVPVYGSVKEAIEATGANVSVIFVPAQFTKAAAKEKDLNYVKLDGSVGIIGNGAGLVMSTLDLVAYAGEEFGGQKPANFLDIGGGASAEVMANGLHIILSDPQVKSVFVNVFGGITACDAVANGIVGALDALGDEENRPLVVRLDGNNVEEGRRILQERNHPLVSVEPTMDGAARRAAELASQA